MNRDGLWELYGFTKFTWAAYDRAVNALPPGALTQQIGAAGWTTLREPLVHVASSWDGWLARKAGDVFVEFSLDTIVTWDEIQEFRVTTRGWLKRLLEEMSDEDLLVKTEPTSDHPDASRTTAADVILHILLHERGHHGDITARLEQAGGSVGNSDYLVYQFFKNRKNM